MMSTESESDSDDVPTGLVNPCSICYANSTLVWMVHVEPLRHVIETQSLELWTRKGPCREMVQAVFQALDTGQSNTDAVTNLVQHLGFALGEQEDPMDFASRLFTRILYDEASDGKRDPLAREFEFRYKSTTHAALLPEEGSTTEAVMTILVLSDYSTRLEQCILEYWQAGEIIKGYEVVGREERTTAIKVHQPVAAPSVAIFVLSFRTMWKKVTGKDVTQDILTALRDGDSELVNALLMSVEPEFEQEFVVQKNAAKMSYPLLINPLDPNGRETHELFAVVSHLGQAGAGHYITYLKGSTSCPASSPNSHGSKKRKRRHNNECSWYCIDNEKVWQSSVQQVMDCTFGGKKSGGKLDNTQEVAFMLVYRER
eukprot:135672_1